MDNLRDFFQKNAIYSPDQELTDSRINELLLNYNLRPLGIGTNARVYRVEGQDWVLKEGRWDLDLSLFEKGKLKVPAEFAENVLKMFSFSFLPNKKEILRQYGLYLEFAKYFGCFSDGDRYFHINKEEIIKSQRLTRELMFESREKIESFYKIKIDNEFWDTLRQDLANDSQLIYYNFLPEEYLLYGKSISKENNGKETYFICQDFVEGVHLHDIPNETLSPTQTNRLKLLALCTLFMNMATGLIPDLRPRYILTEAYDWFSMTENIIVQNEDIKFIDTRWLWRMDDNIVKRGLLIPELTINSAKKYLVEA